MDGQGRSPLSVSDRALRGCLVNSIWKRVGLVPSTKGVMRGRWEVLSLVAPRCTLASGGCRLAPSKEPRMSQSIETPASAGTTPHGGGRDTPRNGRRRRRGPANAILFNQLVLAHFRWLVLHGRYGEFGGLPEELAPAGWSHDKHPKVEERKAAEDRYHEKLDQFTDAEGDIVAAYWSATVPSGIVMTEQRQGWMLNLLRGPKISLHRATTWLTASDPSVAELLHHCDTLGNKAGQILTRTPKRVAMTWIFSTESYLLGIVEGRLWGPIPARSETNGRHEPNAADGNPASAGTTALTSPAGPTKASEGSAKGSSCELTEEELVNRGRAEII